MNDRNRMREKTYCMYHDINWFNWREHRWIRYDNFLGKPPKKRWTYKVNISKLDSTELDW